MDIRFFDAIICGTVNLFFYYCITEIRHHLVQNGHLYRCQNTTFEFLNSGEFIVSYSSVIYNTCITNLNLLAVLTLEFIDLDFCTSGFINNSLYLNVIVKVLAVDNNLPVIQVKVDTAVCFTCFNLRIIILTALCCRACKKFNYLVHL